MLKKTTLAIAASTLACYTTAVQMEDREAAETALAQTEWGWLDDIINVIKPKPKPKPKVKPFIATNAWTTKTHYLERGGEDKSVKLIDGGKYNFEPVGHVYSAWFATNYNNPTEGFNCMHNVELLLKHGHEFKTTGRTDKCLVCLAPCVDFW